jgi:hypothetical protein
LGDSLRKHRTIEDRRRDEFFRSIFPKPLGRNLSD